MQTTNEYNQDVLCSLQELIRQEKLDLILLFSSRHDSRLSMWVANVMCPSAFHYLVVTANQVYFIEVSYRAEALRASTNLPIKTYQDEDLISSYFQEHCQGMNRIGIAGDCPFHHLVGISAEIINLQADINEKIATKSNEAIMGIRKTISCLASALGQLRIEMKPGWSAQQVARKFETLLFDIQATTAFNTSVVIGENLQLSTVGLSSSRYFWEEGSPLLIDCGAKFNGYYSDLTRMFFVEESSLLCTAYQNLIIAQRKVGQGLRAGVSLQNLYNHTRQAIIDVKLDVGSLEASDLGHGIGLSLHESPIFYRESEQQKLLANNCIITLEPEMIFNKYRIRVEDMFLLSESGCERLTAECPD